MEDKLKYATEREKEAYKYRQEGMTFKRIGEKMKITNSTARALVRAAERRISEYDRHYELRKEEEKKYEQPMDISLTYGDGKLLAEALDKRIQAFEKEYKVINNLTNPNREANKSKLPYEYFLIKDLYNMLTEKLGTPYYLF